MKRTNRGQNLYVQWTDGSKKWASPSYMKESFPLGVAKYKKMAGVDDKPEFEWWIKPVLRSTKQMIFKFKSN